MRNAAFAVFGKFRLIFQKLPHFAFRAKTSRCKAIQCFLYDGRHRFIANQFLPMTFDIFIA
ncbi:hypothetical protein LPB140_10300 [Sphingorhabdus lutea]|uniref:Uncharacterized protein n=1 Tax=Sphingorhabdus lutea TaxID=1913578 RepID=A0A1L3JDA3_9SPHN|nr:hypothetical protein LPB140_10300 [Sphingorhabdus lutea]